LDYQARLSGPLLDRIDLQVELGQVSAADLVLPPPTEGSAEVRARVSAARTRQLQRFASLGPPARRLRTNADCSGRLLEEIAMPDEAGLALLRNASTILQLSARGFHRTLKVARTIADLDACDQVGSDHVAEALSYRGEAMRQRQAA